MINYYATIDIVDVMVNYFNDYDYVTKVSLQYSKMTKEKFSTPRTRIQRTDFPSS